MSSEAYVDVQDAASPTKHMRTIQNTVGGNTVQSETIVLSTDGADKYDAREIPDLTASGTLTAGGNTVQLSIVGRAGASVVLTYNSGTGTCVFEYSSDGSAWITGSVFDGSLIRSTTTVSGTYQYLDLAGVQYVRVRANTIGWSSGNVSVALRATRGGLFSDPRTMQKIGATITPLYAQTLGGWTGTAYSQVNALTSSPVGTEGALVVRNIPSGTQIDDPIDRIGRLLGRLNGNVSTGNSSTTLLGVSGVFTGAFEDVTDYAAITISVFADQASAAGGLEFDWSHDGVNQDASSTSNVAASSGRAFSIAPRARFFRVKYTNGAVGQGVFRLGVVYHPTGSGLISRPYSQTMDQDNYAQQTRSVVDGFDDTNFVHIHARTTQPNASDIGLVTRTYIYGNVASGTADAGNPVKIGGIANSGLPSPVSNSQRVDLLSDLYGRPRIIVDRPKLLGLYYAESGNLTILASAHSATAGFFWLINPVGSAVTVYLRSIGFVWSGTAATAFPTAPRITVERITFTGTASGATLTPAKRATTDATAIATLRTASTGMTITAGAVIESFLVGSILTAVGAVSVPEEMWQPTEDDGLIVLAAGEGIVARQADAGTTADSRKAVMTVSWEER